MDRACFRLHPGQCSPRRRNPTPRPAIVPRLSMASDDVDTRIFAMQLREHGAIRAANGWERRFRSVRLFCGGNCGLVASDRSGRHFKFRRVDGAIISRSPPTCVDTCSISSLVPPSQPSLNGGALCCWVSVSRTPRPNGLLCTVECAPSSSCYTIRQTNATRK